MTIFALISNLDHLQLTIVISLPLYTSKISLQTAGLQFEQRMSREELRQLCMPRPLSDRWGLIMILASASL